MEGGLLYWESMRGKSVVDWVILGEAEAEITGEQVYTGLCWEVSLVSFRCPTYPPGCLRILQGRSAAHWWLWTASHCPKRHGKTGPRSRPSRLSLTTSSSALTPRQVGVGRAWRAPPLEGGTKNSTRNLHPRPGVIWGSTPEPAAAGIPPTTYCPPGHRHHLDPGDRGHDPAGWGPREVPSGPTS